MNMGIFCKRKQKTYFVNQRESHYSIQTLPFKSKVQNIHNGTIHYSKKNAYTIRYSLTSSILWMKLMKVCIWSQVACLRAIVRHLDDLGWRQDDGRGCSSPGWPWLTARWRSWRHRRRLAAASVTDHVLLQLQWGRGRTRAGLGPRAKLWAGTRLGAGPAAASATNGTSPCVRGGLTSCGTGNWKATSPARHLQQKEKNNRNSTSSHREQEHGWSRIKTFNCIYKNEGFSLSRYFVTILSPASVFSCGFWFSHRLQMWI
jgi:hypothetical protein